MSDLYLGLAIMTALMGVCFAIAMLATRTAPMWVVDAAAAVVVVAIAVYARWIWEDTFVARLLPFSNLIIVSNWIPLAAGILAGLVWRRIGDRPAKFLGLGRSEYGSTPRKVLASAVLMLVGFGFMAWPIMGEPPQCENDWQGDICLQTTPATCSAAAGATLLQNYGVYASEGEMAELCLTRRGTNWKGLYRGLTLKGREVGRRVEVREQSIAELVAAFTEPCILQCELRLDDVDAGLDYQFEGWVPGQPHSLVLIDVVKDTPIGDIFLIADPTNIFEQWTEDHLETLWHGQTMRLVPIHGPATNREDKDEPGSSESLRPQQHHAADEQQAAGDE